MLCGGVGREIEIYAIITNVDPKSVDFNYYVNSFRIHTTSLGYVLCQVEAKESVLKALSWFLHVKPS